MVKNHGIKCWTYKWGWYLKYQSWPKNSQSYSKCLPILIESIFHCNTQIMKKLFLKIYLGTRVHNEFLNTRFIHMSKSQF
jgi:hypothetical protein